MDLEEILNFDDGLGLEIELVSDSGPSDGISQGSGSKRIFLGRGREKDVGS